MRRWTMQEVRALGLENATKLVAELTPEFDRDAVSARVAAKEGRSQADVLAEWAAKGDASRRRGIAVHEYAERLIGGSSSAGSSVAVIAGSEPVEERLTELGAVDRFWEWAKDHGLASDGVEVLLASEALGCFGFADHIFRRDGAPRLLVDIKAKRLSTENKFERMLAPLDAYPASDLVKASAQTSLYQMMLEREETEAAIVEIDEHRWRMLRAIDLRDELRPWLVERRRG